MQDAIYCQKAEMSDNISCGYVAGRKVGRPHRPLGRRDLSPRTVARFHQKYHRSPEGCWAWTASLFPTGYGSMHLGRYADGRQHTEYAHRVAYVLAHGDIPAGPFVVRHTCDTPACVNPAHLALGTPADNQRDAIARGRHTVQVRAQFVAERRQNVLSAASLYGPKRAAEMFGLNTQTVWRWRREAGLGRNRKAA